ncbi:Response regulator receiver domain-containing protein [Cnuella takakiae]|uniref:Response regulator receiver domain-containing protein n=1 Tax=Cnuella takakiae TaxID=1302690 RepID=A0A1M5GQI5_9BACT|nr:response regulator [Cnuella takakiae]OLY90923.1 hypothetical protein BUE76_02680 [Cnuella takakiae]SHG06025.1 Response regulator receiver domain-containing protein [Cnuella takakiae]
MEKILIIDDDQDQLFLLQTILKRNGLLVCTAQSEQEIYATIAREHPKLILMDVLLSGADGRIICRRLKASSYRSIPVIIFSGHPGAQKNYAEFGADDFLPKPFREKTLLKKLSRFVQVDKGEVAG